MDDYSSRKNKRTITLAVIILLDIALITGLYFHDHKASTNKTSMPGMMMQDRKMSNDHKTANPQKTTTTPKNNQSPKSSSSISAIVGPRNTQLVNTGPGDIVALFVAVFAVSSIAHYLFSNRFSISDR
jgi:hypothetical protein